MNTQELTAEPVIQPTETLQAEERAETTKKSRFSSLSAFFEKNFALFLTPALVLGLYFFLSWVYGVYPFSDKYTAASYDYSAQICPFFDHIFDVFKGKSTLTYSYSIMGGADVTGMFLYTFVSPFSLLFLVCGEGNVVYTAAFVVGFKLAAVGFAGTWFVRKLFKNIPEYLAVVIGLVYAFCGYAFVASTFVAWLDLLIYVPFCVGAFCRFVKTGSFWRFSVLVSCCIYTHFSIASFALFTVLPALIAYALFCVEKERRYKFIARLCVAFLIAIALSLPILVPALVAFLRSSRGGGLFDMLWFGYDTVSWEFKSNKFLERFTEYFYRKGSYIIADAAFVGLTVAWFFRNGIKSSMAKFMLTAGVLTLLPVLVDESMLLLNMGSYYSYSLRFGFLNAVYFMGGACLCLNELCFKKGSAYDGESLGEEAAVSDERAETSIDVSQAIKKTAIKGEKPVTKKEVRLWTYAVIAVGALAIAAMALLAFFSWFVNSDTPSGNHFYNKYKHYDLVYNLRNIPGSYAHSLGGAELICVPFFIVSLTLLFGGWLISGKKLSVRTLALVLSVLLSVQTVFNCGLLVEGNRSTQHGALEDYKKMSAVIAEQDDSYYRTKDHGGLYYNDDGNIRLGDRWSACVAFPAGTNTFTVFSSIIDADNYECRRLFGYQGGSASFKGQFDLGASNRADYFADCFLGYKYVYVPNNGEGKGKTDTQELFEKEYVEKGYMTKVVDKDGNNVVRGGRWAYENKAVFPLGYRVSGEPYKFVKPNPNVLAPNETYYSNYRAENIKALYKFLRGKTLTPETNDEDTTFRQYVSKEDVVELSEYLHGKAADVQVGAGEITATVTAENEDEYLFLSFVASKGYTVTVNGKKAELVNNDLNFLMVKLEQGENVVHFVYSSPYVKYVGAGVLAALVIVAGAILLLKKTKILDKCAPVIAWTGIVVAVGLVAFFMIFPTGVFVSKLVGLLRLKL